ncbi:MAG: hypothetical protein E7470_00115 [Ruminococcaceae bacterium]|nr:hypothetical protein [Oscillospiraceae bacterium]
MKPNKHVACTLGALACAAALMMTLGIGQTQARYDNTVSWKNIYMTQKPTLESNFLAEGGQTVLLSDWDVSTSSYRVLDVRLLAKSGNLSGTLSCRLESDLLTATVDQDSFTVGAVENHATLTIARTEKAALLEEMTTATVRLVWTPAGEDPENSAVWADFTVNLLPGENAAISENTSHARAEMTLSCPDTFSWDESLVMRLTPPEGADTVLLSYEGAEFPANTRYFVVGEEPRVLGDDDMISIPTEGRQEIAVLLDFGWTEEALYRNSFLLSAVAYTDGAEIAAANANVSADRLPLQVEGEEQGYILKTGTQVRLIVEGDLDGFSYAVEQLTKTDGVIAYTASEQLKVTMETTNDGDGETQSVLVISNDSGTAPAGTYRLTLQRIFDGVVISSYEIPLFVCY